MLNTQRWYVLHSYHPLILECFSGLVALRDIDLSYNRLRTLQNRTHGLFEDCLSIKSVREPELLLISATSRTFLKCK